MATVCGQISKVEVKASIKTGKPVYMVCFKCEDGHSRTSWIDSGYRNFQHWTNLLKDGNDLSGLVITGNKGQYIDADSFPKLIPKKEDV